MIKTYIKKLVIFSEDTVFHCADGYRATNPLTRLYAELGKDRIEITVSCPVESDQGSVEGYLGRRIFYSPRPYYGGSVLGFFKSLLRILIPTLRNIRTNVTEADLVMIRLPSPISFWVWRMVRRKRKPHFLYLAGDIREVAGRGEKYQGTVLRLCVIVAAHLFHKLSKRMAKDTLVFTTGAKLHQEFRSIATRCVNLVPSVVSERDIVYCPDIWEGEPFQLLYVGRLVPVKGLRYLFQAMRLLLEKRISTELKVVGEGFHRPALEALVTESGLERQVRFVGQIAFGPKLFEAYRRADIFVLPSLSEGIPKTLVEAMAFGVPIVATCVGGIPDVVKNGETGLLVEPRSPQAMVHAMERLIHDTELRKRVIKNGYVFVREHTVEKQAEQMWNEIKGFFQLEEG